MSARKSLRLGDESPQSGGHTQIASFLQQYLRLAVVPAVKRNLSKQYRHLRLGTWMVALNGSCRNLACDVLCFVPSLQGR